MNFRGQGSFEYVLMIAGVVLVLTVIVVVLQNQATGSSQAVEQNVEYHAKVACDSAKARERAQSLVFSWNFNEGSGTVAADSSGNNNDGTLTNGPKWTTGRIRKGLEFDGKDDYVRTIPDLSPPLSSQEMTGCAWIKIDTVSGIEAPLRDGILMGHFYYFHLWVNSDGTFHFGAQTLISGVSTYEFLDSTNSFPFGVWTHVCVVNKGDSDGVSPPDDGYSKLYVNGNLEDTLLLAGILRDVSWFEVGRHATFPANYFDGVIDEVRFYSKALSAQEVLADMNCGHLA